MPMKNKKNKWFSLKNLVIGVLLFSLLSVPISAQAAGDGGADYIVKYKESAWRPENGTSRLGVVNASELRRLLFAGKLEWYEPDGEIELIDFDPEAELMGSLSPYFEDDQWNLEMIGAETAYRENCLGQGVRVAVLDSGVNPHPDFGDRLLPGHNYIPDASDPDDTTDGYGHGTRTAGIIAAASENGYIGVSPAAEIVPLKVTDGQTAKISAICEAIYGAIDDYGCRVLNMSMGVRTDYASLRAAVAYAEENNVVVVSAVGNSGSAGIYYPAGYDTVIGVGAVDSAGNLYYHSNYNSSVFLSAPGVDVRSTSSSGDYAYATGTSFSVPHVSGAAAVMLGMNGSLTPTEIRELLANTADDTGEAGYDESFGYGILDLSGCVEALKGSGPSPGPGPTPEPTPGPDTACSFLPEAGPAFSVRNNTDSALDCVYLIAVYDDKGVCRKVENVKLALSPGETVSLKTPESGETFGQFLYDAVTLQPLAAARKQ